MDLQKKKSPRLLYFLSFLIPFVLSTAAFALVGLAPFGSNTILKSDAWAQYYPFFSLFRNTLLSGGSLSHTWSIGMGINFLPIFSYYLSSPMYLLSVLVPEAYLADFMFLLTVVKIGLAGLFFSVFLSKTYHSKHKLLPFFALLYSLCAWSAGYYWNIIWLDVFALLPLLITGTVAMLKKGHFRLYVLSLALCFWCNYYLSFCCCIFVLLSFIGYHICKKTGFKSLLRSFLRFGVCTVLAVCLCAVLLIPTLMGMGNTTSAGGEEFSLLSMNLPQQGADFSFSAFLKAFCTVSGRTLTNTAPTDLEGLPNLFCGFSALILAFTFLCNRSFSRRERLFHSIVLLIFVLSCIFRLPDYIWHGFHFPNMLPGRFTFLFSFTVLTMAFRGYTRLSCIGTKRLLLSISAGFAIILMGLLERGELALGYYSLALNLAVFFGTVVALFLGSKIPLPKLPKAILSRRLGLCTGILAILFLCEGFLSIYSGAEDGVGREKQITYSTVAQNVYRLAEEADEELFFRSEMSAGNSISNDGALRHMNGVDVFSSSALVNHGNFAGAMGLIAWPESNSCVYEESAPFTNTLCGIKYLIGKEGSFLDPESTALAASSEGYEARKLDSYIGMGFMTNSALSDFVALGDHKNPLEEQTEIFRLATGLEGELYEYIYDPQLEASEGCSVEATGNNSQFLYKVPSHLTKGTFTLRYTMDRSGLLCMSTRMAGGKDMEVYRNGEFLYDAKVTARGILSLGRVQAGDVIELVYTSNRYKEAGISIYLAFHNDALLEEGLSLLSDEVWNLSYADDTTLKGTVTAKEDGLFYTSIPYEPGWTVTVDGKEVPVAQSYDPTNPDVKITDAMISFPLSAGEHEILMTYRTPGLTVGMILSLTALAVFITLLIMKKKTLFAPSTLTNKGDPQ